MQTWELRDRVVKNKTFCREDPAAVFTRATDSGRRRCFFYETKGMEVLAAPARRSKEFHEYDSFVSSSSHISLAGYLA